MKNMLCQNGQSNLGFSYHTPKIFSDFEPYIRWISYCTFIVSFISINFYIYLIFFMFYRLLIIISKLIITKEDIKFYNN